MSSCLLCGKETPPRRRKYCSTECSAKWFKKKGRKPEGWIRKGDLERAAKQKRRIEYEWYKENWLTADQLADKLKITRSAVHHRAKKLSVPGRSIAGGPAPTMFWAPEDVDRLRYYETPLPEGYITRKSVCAMLDIAEGTFITGGYHDKIKPDKIWQQTHSTRSIQHLYLKSNIEQFIALRTAAANARKQAAKRKQSEKLAARHARAQEALKRRLAREEDAKEARLQRALRREAARQRRLQKSRSRIPDRKTDWQLPEEREKRLFARFPKILKKYSNNTHLYSLNSRAIEVNKKYARLAAGGIVHKLQCKRCGNRRPYHDFYYDASYPVGRRVSCCRVCQSKISKKHYHANKESIKENIKKNYRGKFRTLIGTTIKQDISRMRGSYAKELSITHVWEKIEENCGYNIDDFIEHFESKFDEKMNWLNHGRGADQYYWQIDHIVPRSKFVFTDLDDPTFVECWSLCNMQPLSAYENNIKDNQLRPVQSYKKKFLEKNSALE